MGARIRTLNVLINTFDYNPIYIGNHVGKSEIIEYEAQNPFPRSPTGFYTREMMILDMQHDEGGGILTFTGLTDEQKSWIEEFVNSVI
jgi:hypothetical protein